VLWLALSRGWGEMCRGGVLITTWTAAELRSRLQEELTGE
jgi:hypothetical protein